MLDIARLFQNNWKLTQMTWGAKTEGTPPRVADITEHGLFVQRPENNQLLRQVLPNVPTIQGKYSGRHDSGSSSKDGPPKLATLDGICQVQLTQRSLLLVLLRHHLTCWYLSNETIHQSFCKYSVSTGLAMPTTASCACTLQNSRIQQTATYLCYVYHK